MGATWTASKLVSIVRRGKLAYPSVGIIHRSLYQRVNRLAECCTDRSFSHQGSNQRLRAEAEGLPMRKKSLVAGPRRKALLELLKRGFARSRCSCMVFSWQPQ